MSLALSVLLIWELFESCKHCRTHCLECLKSLLNHRYGYPQRFWHIFFIRSVTYQCRVEFPVHKISGMPCDFILGVVYDFRFRLLFLLFSLFFFLPFFLLLFFFPSFVLLMEERYENLGTSVWYQISMHLNSSRRIFCSSSK